MGPTKTVQAGVDLEEARSRASSQRTMRRTAARVWSDKHERAQVTQRLFLNWYAMTLICQGQKMEEKLKGQFLATASDLQCIHVGTYRVLGCHGQATYTVQWIGLGVRARLQLLRTITRLIAGALLRKTAICTNVTTTSDIRRPAVDRHACRSTKLI